MSITSDITQSITGDIVSDITSIPGTGAGDVPASEFLRLSAHFGLGSGGSNTTSPFEPDLVYVTQTDGFENNAIFLNDAEFGPGDYILANSSLGQQTDAQTLTEFLSNGYAYGTADQVSESGRTFIDVMFDKVPFGMDLVFYTGDGTGTRAIAHNLGKKPVMMWVKNYGGVSNWRCYNEFSGATEFMLLNAANASAVSSSEFANTEPDAENFTAGSLLNISATTYSVIMFASSPPFSNFGSYTGTAASLSVDTGIDWDLLITKRTDSSGDWLMTSSSGVVGTQEISGTDPAVTSGAGLITKSGNNFVMDASAGTAINASGGSYLWYAVKSA